MSEKATIEYARNVIRKVGAWSGLKFLARQGVPFEVAYEARTGKRCKRAV